MKRHTYLLLIGLVLPMAPATAETTESGGTATQATPASDVAGQTTAGDKTSPASTSPVSRPANQNQGQVKRLKAEIKWARAALKRQREKTKALEKQLSAQATRPIAVDDSEYSSKPVILSSKSGKPVTGGKDGIQVYLLWIGISFAMLVVGFISGVTWLRERYRKRLGGMHLRV